MSSQHYDDTEPREAAAPGNAASPPEPPEPPEQPEAPAPEPDADPIGTLETALAERTADLQRLQAEYLNYKRRVDRDREAVREAATAVVLTALLPVLDDLDRARSHGELEGGFKAVADSLQRILAGLGLESFGEAGEPFDPRIHEALLHEYSETAEGPTAAAILQPGYRIRDRIVRPARVAVVEPAALPGLGLQEPEQEPEHQPEQEPDEPQAEAAEQQPQDDRAR